jgi:hypothetical protein
MRRSHHRLALMVSWLVTLVVIEASIECRSGRGSCQVKFPPPHPEGRKAISAEGGRYLPEEEAVLVENFSGQARTKLSF